MLRASRWKAALTAIGFIALSLLFVKFCRPNYHLQNTWSLHALWHQITPLSVEDKAKRLLSSNPFIDGHMDLGVIIRQHFLNRIYDDEFSAAFEHGTLPGPLDLHRLRQGMSGGGFWSLYTPCPVDDENQVTPLLETLEQIDMMNRLMQRYPADFSGPVNSETAAQAFKRGKLISPLCIEGLHQIGNEIGILRIFHALGVRYATLTHNCHNSFADAAMEGRGQELRKSTPKWGGISPRGRQAVREMNRLGLIVDISHTSEDTMMDVLGGTDVWVGSAAPVILSHSSVYEICPHPRNVKDPILRLVQERNSLIMIAFEPQFISCSAVEGNVDTLPTPEPNNNTLAQVVRHIRYIGNLIGYEHVGIGSDYGVTSGVPVGLEDVSRLPSLVAELLRQGVSDNDVIKVIGGNLMRIWNDVDKISARLQAKRVPVLEDEVSPW